MARKTNTQEAKQGYDLRAPAENTAVALAQASDLDGVSQPIASGAPAALAASQRPLQGAATGKLTLSNPTRSVRGLMLRKGIMLLQPGEVKVVPIEDADEVRALFKSRTVQAIIDAGLLRVSGLGDQELIDQPTPKAPETLTDSVQVGSTGLTVGANSARQYSPDSQSKLRDAGVMSVG